LLRDFCSSGEAMLKVWAMLAATVPLKSIAARVGAEALDLKP